MRVRYTEITAKRICGAAYRRIRDVPDALAWKHSTSSRINKNLLDRFRDLHSGERCFVIANGPSLRRMDLSPLSDLYTISMNRAYLLYKEWGFYPSYYACINELVLEQFADDISQLPMPRFVNFNRRHLFSGAGADDGLTYLRLALNFWDRFTGDITHSISSGGTVTFTCLQLAYFMGFEEVVLIGMDHNFVEKGVPNTTETRRSETDESHCHPDYFPKGIKWQLPDLYRSELAYSMARQAFERDGRRIVDATVDGNCNVFEKADFESLL